MKDIRYYGKLMGIELADEQMNQLNKYQDLLLEWNNKINLTAITDPEEIALKHFADSLSALPFILKCFSNKIISKGNIRYENESAKNTLNKNESTKSSHYKSNIGVDNYTNKESVMKICNENESEIYISNKSERLESIHNVIDSTKGCCNDSSSLSLIDVGTGAGFPGIPLKIFYPSFDVTLMDSLNKRVSFLNEVIKTTNLEGVKTVHSRAEDGGTSKEYREKYDIAIARAVANLPVLCEYCMPFVKIGGVFIAMKTNSQEEITSAKHAIKVLGGDIESINELCLPESDIKRSIIVIRKTAKTPSIYPRKAGKPEKEPLLKK